MLFAGSIKSGKTRLSTAVAQALGASYGSFGAEVRDRAVARGLDSSDRRVLQDLGEELVETDAVGFTRAVILRCVPGLDETNYVVLDGLRHLRIAKIIEELLGDCRPLLIFVETSDHTRRLRSTTDGSGSSSLQLAEAHRNESELKGLREISDLVVSGEENVTGTTLTVVNFVRIA